MFPTFRIRSNTKPARRKAPKRSLKFEQLEDRYALSIAAVLNLDPSVTYYDTLSMPITPTGETGIHGTGTPGQYYITGNAYQDGLLYEGPISGAGLSYVVNYTDGSTNQYITNVYGPDPIDATTLRLVGTYKNANGTSDEVDSFIFEGTKADFANPANYRSFSISGATYTYAHSTAGDLVVGNYYTPVQDAQGVMTSGLGRGFIYSVSQNQEITDIQFPGSISTTAYGIVYNGGTSYTICGGFSMGFASDDANQDDLMGTPYLVDYDSATGQFSNWTTFAAPGDGNILAHFQGISSVQSGIYTLAASAAPGLTTQPEQGYLVTVARNTDGTFSTAAIWTPLDNPSGTATTADSVYGNQVIGVVANASPDGYQATINTSDAALLSYLADHQPTVSAPPSALQIASLSASQRWDWLAGTVWYVPGQNMLAYTLTSDLSDPTPVADQTLWFIDQSEGGEFSGVAIVQLSSEQLQERNLSGTITPDGQIRITFSSNDPSQAPTIGIGQARFVDGAVRLEMQMASGSETIVGHWAYQSQLTAGTIPPDPTTGPFGDAPLDSGWRWLLGTRWALADKVLLGSDTPGIFTISAYENGYFWGSGTVGAQSFNVFGSVTPEGNVLMLASVGGAAPTSQSGFLVPTGAGAIMTLRSYQDAPGTGLAWIVPASLISAAGIIPPTDVPNFAIPGQSASVQALGQNALPATDVPATWPAAGVLANATPWALVDGTFTALGGVTRIDSLEVGQLGNFAALFRSGHDAISGNVSTDKPDADTARRPHAVEELPSPRRKARRLRTNLSIRSPHFHDQRGQAERPRQN